MPIKLVIYCVCAHYWHHIHTPTSRQLYLPERDRQRETRGTLKYWKMKCCHFAIHLSPNYAHLTNRAAVRSRLISRQNPITARAFITRSCSSRSDWRYSATWLRSVTSNLKPPSPDASQENAIIALKINLRRARPVWLKDPTGGAVWKNV